MSSGQTFTQATGNGDCALCSPDGRRLGASSHILEIASTVLGGIISALGANFRKRQRDDGNTEDHAKWDIPVDEPYEAWEEVLKQLYRPLVVPDPGSLTLASARVVFPIAHKYAMHGLLCECVATVRRDLLIWPADGLTDLSTLLGWLSLGSSLHDQTLVNVCLDKLFVAMPVARHAFCEALYSREIREVLHDLDPETMLSLLSLLGGLSSPAQGLLVPDLRKPWRVLKTLAAGDREVDACCLHGSDLIYSTSASRVGTDPQVTVHPLFDELEACSFDPDCDSRELYFWQGHLCRIACNRSGRFLAGVATSGSLGIWDLGTPKDMRMMMSSAHGPGSRPCVGWVGGTDTVLSAGRTGEQDTVKFWDVQGRAGYGAASPLLSLNGHTDKITALATSADGCLAASSSDDGTVKLWDLRTGASVRSLTGHEGSVRAVALNSDGRMALSGSDDKTLRTWDLGTGLAVRKLEGHRTAVTSLVMNEAGSIAVSCAADSSGVFTWDLATGAASEAAIRGRVPDAYDDGAQMVELCASPNLSSVVVMYQFAEYDRHCAAW